MDEEVAGVQFWRGRECAGAGFFCQGFVPLLVLSSHVLLIIGDGVGDILRDQIVDIAERLNVVDKLN